MRQNICFNYMYFYFFPEHLRRHGDILYGLIFFLTREFQNNQKYNFPGGFREKLSKLYKL